MRIDLDRWEEILVTITRNKTRSLLTAFGVFWGIFMLIVLMGGSEGMKDMLSANFEGFATNSGFLGTNETSKVYKGFQKGRYWELVNADVEKVRRSVPEIDVVSPNLARWGVGAVCGENRTSVTLKGLYPEYARIEEQRLSEGRFINDTMGGYIAKKLVKKLIGMGKAILGARILVMGMTFKENVADIRNSKVVDIINELKDFGVEVDVVDPYADPEEVKKMYGFRLIEKPLGNYDAVVVAVAHDAYQGLDEKYFKSLTCDKAVLVDVKGMYRDKIHELKYWSL